MLINLDQWQQEFINYQGNKLLVSGRQTGKSEAAGYDNGEFALNNEGVTCLIISKTERQAEELLIKAMNYVIEKEPRRVGLGEYKTLKHCLWIMPKTKGGKPSRIICLPTGIAGEGIKGLTIHKLTIDEAQLPDDDVFYNISPMLLTTGGHISLIGTPKGKKGYFWKAFNGEIGEWKKWHVSSEEVINARPVSESWQQWRRDAALKFLEDEKKRLPSKWYDQEYRGFFIEPVTRMFSSELLKSKMVLKRREPQARSQRFIGVDVGRIVDPTAIELFEEENGVIKQFESKLYKEVSIPQTAKLTKDLSKLYNVRFAGIDGGGMGVGVVDLLLEDDEMKRVVMDLNNARRSTSYRDNGKAKLLKEDMYFNLLSLLMAGKVLLLDDEEILESLSSVYIEYLDGKTTPIITAINNHHAEGIIRGVYLANKYKDLNFGFHWI